MSSVKLFFLFITVFIFPALVFSQTKPEPSATHKTLLSLIPRWSKLT